MRAHPNRFICLAVLAAVLLVAVSCSSGKTRVILLPNEDGSTGALAVGKGDRITLLDSPMSAAEVGSFGSVEKSTVTEGQVEKEFAGALAAQPPAPISFTLYFEEGTTVVLESSRPTLKALFDEVAQRQAVEVQVTGHTDTVGTEADNDRLSAERAELIKKMLIDQGLRASFIRAVGRGEREPLVSTTDNTREPKNRRVEVIVR
ncbi:MAG: OmpA family protein [Desulfobacterales bacterium]|jgi:outer membrane protein OmpA-like peptidoglycan-associated protein